MPRHARRPTRSLILGTVLLAPLLTVGELTASGETIRVVSDPGFHPIGGPLVRHRAWVLPSLPLGNEPTLSDDPVALAAGELVDETDDLVIGGVLPMGLSRYTGSLVDFTASIHGFFFFADSPMGANWIHNYLYLLVKESDTRVLVLYHRGSVVAFEKVGEVWNFSQLTFFGSYAGVPYQMVERTAPATARGAPGTLLEMMDPKNDLILTFDVTGMATSEVRGASSIRDRNGNTHTLTYNADGTLDRVADGLGRSLDFSYVESGGMPRVSQVADPAGRTVQFAYTGAQLTSATDPRGKTTIYTYSPDNLLLTITAARGNTRVTNGYDFAQRVVSQRDGEGNETTFAYAGLETTMTDPLGGIRTFRFNVDLRLTELVDEAGSTIQYGYDGSQRLTSVTDRLGDTSTTTYHSGSGKVASRTDAEGQTWSYTHTPQIQDGFTFYDLTRVDYPDGTFTLLAYDGSGNVTSIIDRGGETWTYAYNGGGQPLSTTRPSGGTTTYTYNPDATLATAQDPAGNLTTYLYDASKRLVRVEHADGSHGEATWDAADNLLSLTEENGTTTTFTYDDNGNLTTITDPLGNVRTFGYDGNDDLISATDPLGATLVLERDGLRRVSTATDRNSLTTQYVYDSRRRLIRVVDPEGESWSYTYDDEGVRTSQRDAADRTWTYTTDKRGRITAIEDPLGRVSSAVYDGLGRVTALRNPEGEVATFDLDDRGGLVATAIPEGIGAAYVRDVLGRVTQATDARALDRSWSFDSSGRVQESQDAAGQTSLFAHDDRNRLQHVDLPLGSLDLHYEETGLLTQMVYSDGTLLDFGYDDAQRLTSATGLVLTYDAAGRLASSNGILVGRDPGGRIETFTFEPGKTVTYSYDGRGLLTSVSDWTGTGISFAYDDAGRPATLTRTNGVVTTLVYDDAGQLTSLAESRAAVALSSIQLTRDAVGRVRQAERDLPLQPAPPAELDQLAYDDADQVVGFTYDLMGRLVDDGERTMGWNLASHRLTSTAAGSTVTYTYDALAHRLTRSEAGALREYVWNYALGLPSVSLLREGGALSRIFVHTPAGALLYSIGADDQPSFYHFDETGSTLFLTDAGGAITDTYAYDAYGRTAGSTGGSDNPFTWGGRFGILAEKDGLYYMRARTYDSRTARFLSRDPLPERLGDVQSLNRYAYANQDPLTFVDPRGGQVAVGRAFGFVCDELGGALPGVTVTLTSPSLQGARVASTVDSGAYQVESLPPGSYKMTAELEGFATCVKQVEIKAGKKTDTRFHLALAEVVEEIVATSNFDVISETSTGASTYTHDELESLPVARTAANSAALAPGVTSAASISGAASYENLFLINGVTVSDNVRSQFLPLFVEDAVSETTTSVSGVAAEYGRFTGGVVNVITKSGGTELSGGVTYFDEWPGPRSFRLAPIKTGFAFPIR